MSLNRNFSSEDLSVLVPLREVRQMMHRHLSVHLWCLALELEEAVVLHVLDLFVEHCLG